VGVFFSEHSVDEYSVALSCTLSVHDETAEIKVMNASCYCTPVVLLRWLVYVVTEFKTNQFGDGLLLSAVKSTESVPCRKFMDTAYY